MLLDITVAVNDVYSRMIFDFQNFKLAYTCTRTPVLSSDSRGQAISEY